MKLNYSEITFLLQILFHLKASGGIGTDLDLNERLNSLYQKVCLHVFPDLDGYDSFVISHSEESLEEDCSWKEEEKQSENCLSSKDLLDLDPVRVEYQEDKRTLKFTHGVTFGVDIELDDGYEIFSDVTQVVRKGKSISIDCADGRVEFAVQKFPKKWTNLIALDQTYEVEVET